MLKCKIFTEKITEKLEKKINDFFYSQNIDIELVAINQTESVIENCLWTTITLVYQE